MDNEITVRIPDKWVDAADIMAEFLAEGWRDYSDIKMETAGDLMLRACDKLGVTVDEIEVGTMVQPNREDNIGMFARLHVPCDKDLIALKLRFDEV